MRLYIAGLCAFFTAISTGHTIKVKCNDEIGLLRKVVLIPLMVSEDHPPPVHRRARHLFL